jgi:hypothetical protein
MVSLQLRTLLSSATAAMIACLATPVMNAGTTGNPVIYTASGTFGVTPISGADTLRLSGEPFTISISAKTGTVPGQHGSNWAIYGGLGMSGTVYSGLTGAEPIPIQSDHAELQLTVGPDDIINATFVVPVIGVAVKIYAHLYVPGGTFSSTSIAPFPTVAVNLTGTTVTYADTTAATILSIQSATVGAAYPTTSVTKAFSLSAPLGTRTLDFSPALFVRRSSYLQIPATV